MILPPRIAFAGTPAFAVPALRAMIQHGYPPVAVLTQPDRPAGRGRKPASSPIKQLAEAHGLPVWQPETLRQEAVQQSLRDLHLDLLVVIAYGLILPPSVLEAPRRGAINLHASLLPRWRGAAPIQRAILEGDQETGVCLMQMERGLDTGPVLDQVRTPLTEEDTSVSLQERLAELAADLLLKNLPRLLAASLSALPQSTAGVCYAHKLQKNEAWMDWQRPATALSRQVRGLLPWPVAQTVWNNTVLRIHGAHAPAEQLPTSLTHPGTLLGVDGDGVRVLTGSGQLCLTQVQLPGRRVVAAAQWWREQGVPGLCFEGPETLQE